MWFLFYPGSSVSKAITNMKIKIETIAKILAEQISQASNNKIMS